MMKRSGILLLTLGLMLTLGLSLQAQMAKPDMTTLNGKVIDLTCAAKGKVMMDSWGNAENDAHMTPDGKMEGCATMCLKGGQPAALYSGGKVTAVFACNPRATLANYAAKDVEVRGFWAGSKKDAARSFVPAKIRAGKSGDWAEVNCATMH